MSQHDIEDIVSGALAADLTTGTSTPVIAAQGAGVRTIIESLSVSNSHATQGTRVDILDGAVLKWSGFVPALSPGANIPVCLLGSENTAWNVQCGTAGAAVRCSLSGYKWAKR